jgi:calmodulin
LTILNRPDGFKPAGTPGTFSFKETINVLTKRLVADEFIRGFQVFDKEGNGFIGAGELRYVLTQLGEKMSDEEVDELLKGVQIGA